MLGVIIVLSVIRIILLNAFLLIVNTRIHNRMLRNIVKAKVAFFDKNPIGRILNRFSSDLGILDKMNSYASFTLLDGYTRMLTFFVTLCVLSPWIAISAIFIVAVLSKIQTAYSFPVLLSKKIEL